jgi:esterase
MRLHVETLQAPGATPTRALVFLHGILGQGTNLRALAKRFVDAQPSWQALLLDLRAHGKSLGVDGEDTVVSASEDVAQMARASAVPVRAVLGHSFGGKVAMLVPERITGLEHLVILDSAPGQRLDFRGSELTMRVLSVLDNAPAFFPSREAFVAHLKAASIDVGIGQWLAMNLERGAAGLHFTLSLTRIRSLLASYFECDCWPVLERMALDAGPGFHLIIGSRSGVFDEGDRARARALAARSGGRCTVDELPTGHWVHVEDFEGTVRLVLQRLSP